MKNRFLVLLSILVLLSVLLAACGGQATEAPVVEEPAAPAVEEPAAPVVEEPAAPAVEEPAAPEPVAPAGADELDAAYTAFLADMVAYNTVGLDGLNEMLAESPPFLLDVRSLDEVEKNGYIEGSVVIPLRELGANLDLLPAFDEPIVSYCGSGWRCTIAMTALGAMGWEDVKGLKGGSFGGWIEAGYPIMEGLPEAPAAMAAAEPDPEMEALFAEVLSSIPEGWGGVTPEALNTELAENPDLIVIDVRRVDEVDEKGIIDAPNYVHVPLEEMIAMRADWPADTAAPIVIYCGSGHRSTMAMTILWAYGYEDVRSLKGGFSAWVGDGYPVLGGAPDMDGAFSTFLADMEAYNTLSLEAFNEMMVEEPLPFVLDVREVAELEEKGYIEGAINIPLREVGKNISALPSFDTPIVSYCGSGWRCTIAMTLLEGLGYEEVYSLKGGSFGGWVEAGYPVAEGLPPEPLVLDLAAPDPVMLAVIDDTFANIPEGYGGVTAETLNLELAENPDLILIDVRRLDEVEEKGVIESVNYIHIPLEDFIAMKDLWPADTDASIVIYCGSGHRSTMAMSILWAYGYSDVLSLKEGFGGWAEAGYPVVEYAAVMP
jgi:rhodanese-related sulfurtransferase